MNAPLDQIRELIGEGDMEAAIEQLHDVLSGQIRTQGESSRQFRNLMNEVTIHKSSFRAQERDHRQGLNDDAQHDRRSRRLAPIIHDGYRI